MTSLHKLIEAKGSDWVDLHLKTKRNPSDPDIESLVEHIINGMSPGLAAKNVSESNEHISRARAGLVWLAYEVEDQLYTTLGESIESLLAELKSNQEVEVSTSRARKLELAADAAGLRTERVTILRLR